MERTAWRSILCSALVAAANRYAPVEARRVPPASACAIFRHGTNRYPRRERFRHAPSPVFSSQCLTYFKMLTLDCLLHSYQPNLLHQFVIFATYSTAISRQARQHVKTFALTAGTARCVAGFAAPCRLERSGHKRRLLYALSTLDSQNFFRANRYAVGGSLYSHWLSDRDRPSAREL
jgi:hypothetical protein